MRILEKRGHTAVLASNGKEAVALLERESFDLVLMDLEMPEMSGFEATAAIRARERQTGRHIPILALTAHAMKGDRERCLAAGMDGYVAKPIQARELYQAIAELVPDRGDFGARSRACPTVMRPPATRWSASAAILNCSASYRKCSCTTVRV